MITSDQIPWERYLKPADKERVIPAEALAERAKREILFGSSKEPGFQLPWEKTHGKVFVNKGSVVLWAGWSRHGKTRMLKQVMLHSIANGEKPLIASMEEEVHGVFKDMARMACLNIDPAPREIDRFIDFVRGNLWLYDQQGLVQPHKLMAVIRYAAAELKVTQVMIDSLMMLGIPRDDFDAQARFVSELHTFAMNNGVTIHLVAHMRKRDGKDGEKCPGSLHDVSGGHEIGGMVDSVFIVWRDLVERQPGDKAPEYPVALKVDKQRGTLDWMGTIGLRFHQTSRQFVEDINPRKFWSDEQPF